MLDGKVCQKFRDAKLYIASESRGYACPRTHINSVRKKMNMFVYQALFRGFSSMIVVPTFSIGSNIRKTDAGGN